MPDRTTRHTRRVWLQVAAAAAVAASGIAVLGWLSGAAAREQTASLDSVTRQVAIPGKWHPAGSDTRVAGPFGLCLGSAVDVRGCPSAWHSYTLDTAPGTAADLEVILPDARWRTGRSDCVAPPRTQGSAVTCASSAEVDGLAVTVRLSGTAVSPGEPLESPVVTVTVTNHAS